MPQCFKKDAKKDAQDTSLKKPIQNTFREKAIIENDYVIKKQKSVEIYKVL